MITIRPEAVHLVMAVVADSDEGITAPTSKWTRDGGRPLNDDELRLSDTLIVSEVRAGLHAGPAILEAGGTL